MVEARPQGAGKLTHLLATMAVSQHGCVGEKLELHAEMEPSLCFVCSTKLDEERAIGTIGTVVVKDCLLP